MNEGEVSSEFPWVWAQVEKEAKSDVMIFSERVGQLFALVGIFIFIVFIAIHQTRPTGFFTDEFGTVAAILLYGMLILGMPPAILRFITGRKNVSRLFDAIGLAVSVVVSIYLLVVFPFDFAHFADALPGFLEFSLDWVSATFARFMMVIAIIASSIMSIYNLLLYFAVKQRLSESRSDVAPPE